MTTDSPAAEIDVQTANLRSYKERIEGDYRHTALRSAPPNRNRPFGSPTSDTGELYKEFAPLVKRLLRQYGTDPELREDLAREIYWLFCSFAEAYDPERGVPFRPYLVRQLTATVANYARHLWLRKSRELSEDGTGASAHLKPEHDPTTLWISEYTQQQVLATLPTAVAQLPDLQRRVVLWRYYDNLPFEQIAGLLNLEASTCRSLLRHAINYLRKRMHTCE